MGDMITETSHVILHTSYTAKNRMGVNQTFEKGMSPALLLVCKGRVTP